MKTFFATIVLVIILTPTTFAGRILNITNDRFAYATLNDVTTNSVTVTANCFEYAYQVDETTVIYGISEVYSLRATLSQKNSVVVETVIPCNTPTEIFVGLKKGKVSIEINTVMRGFSFFNESTLNAIAVV